jgi:hypothetical protein
MRSSRRSAGGQLAACYVESMATVGAGFRYVRDLRDDHGLWGIAAPNSRGRAEAQAFPH